MRRLLVSLCVACGVLISLGGVASAQTAPAFKLGFWTLAQQIPADVVGTPTENEYFNLSNGNSEQHTTTGLMAWRKADNWTAYTNGYWTWVNGPVGVQSRLNTERFPWEAGYNPPQLPANSAGDFKTDPYLHLPSGDILVTGTITNRDSYWNMTALEVTFEFRDADNRPVR